MGVSVDSGGKGVDVEINLVPFIDLMSCLVAAERAEGCEVVTVEGLDNPDGTLSPLQQAFIDAAVYRGGDLVSGWIYAGLAAIGLPAGAIALVAAPVAGIWVAIALQIGRARPRGTQAAPPVSGTSRFGT